MPEEVKQRRLPIPIDNIKAIQSDCMSADDDLRWIVALLNDTGMRLGEVVGLAKSDIILDADIPYINLLPHRWRRLKTSGSQRCIPLVGKALWGANRAIKVTPDIISGGCGNRVIIISF